MLVETPAAVRFLSCEPLLGPIDMNFGMRKYLTTVEELITPRVDWVIVGGESGPKSRECNVDWVRSIARQCDEADVPCFVKQLGAHVVDDGATAIVDTFPPDQCWPDSVCLRMNARNPERRIRLRDRKGGDFSEWPRDLRVQQFPNVVR